MPNLLYLANIRLPTEKAHGLQIMQNCEAFAEADADVRLWVARRVNTSEMAAVKDVYAHYGVRQAFSIRRLPCLDLLNVIPASGLLSKLIFYTQAITYTLVLLIAALFTRADSYYSRDTLTLFALSLVKPRKALVYEAHMLANGRGGRWLQRQVIQRVGTVIPITRKLQEDLQALSTTSQPPRFRVAHDGIRRERFANMPPQAEARAQIGWPQEAFIVGYVGRLQTMAADKGVGTLVEALAQVEGVALGLVGGPDDMAKALRQHWLRIGLSGERFLYAGQVAPDKVPLYLAALDICVIPLPWTPHFAYYTSPMKLFEYMASQRAIIASDLPSIGEVVKDGETALLVPPTDAPALATAIQRLRDDAPLRQRLADAAYADVMSHYTWAARATAILQTIQEVQS
ncbi:MAG: glycosyltransferase family 4 protein [Chloroflexi bacterium]|nr:glycosyltransferase family 4 protein [Chloroflexota bacterium]MCC6897190.1 glycosyltransferase family 4 protein [Anaerolineae bacterium]